MKMTLPSLRARGHHMEMKLKMKKRGKCRQRKRPEFETPKLPLAAVADWLSVEL